jgi:TorA maturation chaperone TorD
MTMSDYDPDEATARQDLCRFLSACYYEPAPEFAEEKLFDSIVTAAARLHPELAAMARRLREAFEAQDLQTLLVDYTRLFLGPINALAKPYGSCWLPGTRRARSATAKRSPPSNNFRSASWMSTWVPGSDPLPPRCRTVPRPRSTGCWPR